jgi:hypothetical protein
MSAGRSIEVRIDSPRLKAAGGAGQTPDPSPDGPVVFQFHGDFPGIPTTARAQQFVGGLAQTDPRLAERLGGLLPALLSHEATLFEWLSRDEDHGRRFVEDPVGAFAEAVPDLSPQLMADLRAVAQDLAAISTEGGAR